MTTLGDKFKAAAQKNVLKFSIGTYDYQKLSSSYDPDTGDVTNAESVVKIPAARYNISDDKRASMSYSEETCIIVMAGLDLGSVVPKTGGIIIFPDDTRHRVVYVEPDQYGAAYFAHVTVTPIGA